MEYKVVFSERATKQMKKLDASVQAMILAWLKKNLEGKDNPRAHGKGLTENLSGKWRYRIGDYRIIARIFEKTITILVLEVGHRNKIYQ
jgi:mRNA interferase RelE/StbE